MTPHPLSPRRPMLLFWILLAFAAVGLVWSVICTVDLLLHPIAPVILFDSPAFRLIAGLGIGPATITIGILILRREPHNIVGIFILIIGESWIATGLRLDIQSPAASGLAYLYSGSLWAALFFLAVYFPDGIAYPPRFARWINGLALYANVWGIIAFAGNPMIIQGFNSGVPLRELPNPFYMPLIGAFGQAINPIGPLTTIVTMGISVISILMRYRMSDRWGQMQIRWLGWCFTVFVILAFIGFAGKTFTTYAGQPLATAYNVVVYSWLGLFPAFAVGNAILRHRLYDIDIIIRRTIIYSLLTAMLAALYFGGVVLGQAALRPLIGENSDAAIVISTLAIAALFTPLRRRVQDGIDRRFYRRKYDAERTLAAFNATMRDEVDLDKLQAALVNVVQETMQPKSVGLWVRDSNRKN